MAYIDDKGLVYSEPGDILKVEHRLRASAYGDIEGGKPLILVSHLTGNHIPYGANSSAQDGTKGMAGRVAAGTAKYYAVADAEPTQSRYPRRGTVGGPRDEQDFDRHRVDQYGVR
jgi:hypothetical protein